MNFNILLPLLPLLLTSRSFAENPEHIPVATCIEQSPSTFDFLATLARPQRLQELAVRGVERDTLRQMQNDLLTHAEVYSDS